MAGMIPRSLQELSSVLARKVVYSPGLFPALSEHKVRRPIFILGCGRSGTTMLMEAVGSHKDIATFYSEANDLWHPGSYPWRESDLKKPPFWLDPEKFTEMSLRDWASGHPRKIRAIFGAYQLISGRKCFLNKSAMITFMAPKILEVFQGARIIHIYRDGRAVAHSYARHEFPKMREGAPIYRKAGCYYPFVELLEKCALCWNKHVIAFDKMAQEDGWKEKGILFETSYRDFCRNPKESLTRMAQFLGLDPNGFRLKDYSHIRNRNQGYADALDRKTIKRLTELMEPGLRLKGYLS